MKNKYILKFSEVEDNEYLMSIVGDYNYKQDVKIKIDSFGISKYCENHYILTHHFDSIENESFCYSAPPFISKRVDWVKKAQYMIDNKCYEVICYSEISGSTTFYSSYYLRGFGFICFYKSDADKYILCDSIKDVGFNLKVLHEINQRLISDSVTFERHILAKAFPKYHRSTR